MIAIDTEGLSQRQVRAVGCILQTSTLEEAAELAGVGESTLWRWMRDTRFVKALKDAEVLILDDTIRRILTCQHEAITVLHDTMTGDASPGIKLRAAVATLDMAMRLWAFRASLQRGETPQTGDDWMAAEDESAHVATV